jgi:hypothetical protein
MRARAPFTVGEPPAETCPICAAPVPWDYCWRDRLSEREFEISGMCQACQDRIFDADEEQVANRVL